MNGSFVDTDIARFLSIWRGNMKFINKSDKGIVELETRKKYKIMLEGEDRKNALQRIFLIIESYDFLTIEGTADTLDIKANVRPDYITQFENFCHLLIELEDKNIIEPVE